MEPLFQQERAADGEPEGLLILHHGRGTDERDLLGLADLLDPERRLRVVTPRAPLTLPGSPGYHWYVVPRVGYPDPQTLDAARAACWLPAMRSKRGREPWCGRCPRRMPASPPTT